MTLLLSPADVARMRSVLNMTLPDTAVVIRRTQVSDGAGGYTETEATVATVACRVAVPSGSEQVIAGKLDAVGTWTITLPALTTALAPDRILVYDGLAGEAPAVGATARTFEIAFVLRPRSWELSRRVLVTETL